MEEFKNSKKGAVDIDPIVQLVTDIMPLVIMVRLFDNLRF